MKIFYLSDLHLRNQQEKNCQRLVEFLRTKTSSGDIVVLGGDIFDLYIGDKKYFRDKFSTVIEAILAIAQNGRSIFYLEGNHDFHLRGAFGEHENIKIETDDFFFSVAGKKFWISHGDWIDEEDKGYRLLRNITRSLPLRMLLKILPGALLGGVGEFSSRKSRQYNDVEKISAEKKERTRQLFIKFAEQKISEGSDFVLVGHSHLKDQLKLKGAGREGEYINLGFSQSSLLYAEWEPGRSSFVVAQYP